MTLVDWMIAAVVGLSMLFGVVRGFVREVLSLAGWIAGIWLAIVYSVPAGNALPIDLGAAEARTAVAALAILLATLLASGLLAWLVGKMLAAVRLTGADRLLGALFGLARAVLVLLVVVLFAGRTALAQQPPWRDSLLLPQVKAAVRLASPWLPPALSLRNGA